MALTQPTLKAILFDMDDTLIDWSQRTNDWDKNRQVQLARVLEYVTMEVHAIDEPAAFYQAVTQLLSSPGWIVIRMAAHRISGRC